MRIYLNTKPQTLNLDFDQLTGIPYASHLQHPLRTGFTPEGHV